MFLGHSLRRLREAKGMTQDAMAQQCGVSRSTLSRLELNLSVPDVETLIRAANGLGIPLTKFLIEVGVAQRFRS